MELAGRRVAILVERLYEDLELWYPYYRLREAGAEVLLLGTGKAQYEGKHGIVARPDLRVDDALPDEYDGVVIPGGYSPDYMRRHRPLVDFVRQLHERGKVVAFICHAGWVPASARILKGRRCTSVVSIRDDLENAGAEWLDKPVVHDGNFVSSRSPDDLPAFCRTLIAALGRG